MRRSVSSDKGTEKTVSYNRLVFRIMHSNKIHEWRKGQGIKVWSQSSKVWCAGEICAISRDQEGYCLDVRYWATAHVPKAKFLGPSSSSIQPIYLSKSRRNSNQNENQSKTNGNEKTIDYSVRESWNTNSKVECFSNSHKKWFNATVISQVRYTHDSEDWLKIQWNVNNRSTIEKLKSQIKKLKKENNVEKVHTLEGILENTPLQQVMSKEVGRSSIWIRHRYSNLSKEKELKVFKEEDYECLSVDLEMNEESKKKKKENTNTSKKRNSETKEIIVEEVQSSLVILENEIKEESMDNTLLKFFESSDSESDDSNDDESDTDTNTNGSSISVHKKIIHKTRNTLSDDELHEWMKEKKELNEEIERYKFKLKLSEQDLKAEQFTSGPLLKEVELQKIQLENIMKENKKLKKSLSKMKSKSENNNTNEDDESLNLSKIEDNNNNSSSVKGKHHTIAHSCSSSASFSDIITDDDGKEGYKTTKALIDATYDQKVNSLQEQIMRCKRELQEKDLKLNEFKQSNIHFEHSIRLLEKQLKEELFIRETKETAESDIADYMPKLRTEVRNLTLRNEELIRKCADTQILVKRADLQREKFEDLYENVKRDTNNYQNICSRSMNSAQQMIISIDSLQHMIVHMSSHMQLHLSNIRVCNEQICNHMQDIIESQANNNRHTGQRGKSFTYKKPHVLQSNISFDDMHHSNTRMHNDIYYQNRSTRSARFSNQKNVEHNLIERHAHSSISSDDDMNSGQSAIMSNTILENEISSDPYPSAVHFSFDSSHQRIHEKQHSYDLKSAVSMNNCPVLFEMNDEQQYSLQVNAISDNEIIESWNPRMLQNIDATAVLNNTIDHHTPGGSYMNNNSRNLSSQQIICVKWPKSNKKRNSRFKWASSAPKVSTSIEFVDNYLHMKSQEDEKEIELDLRDCKMLTNNKWSVKIEMNDGLKYKLICIDPHQCQRYHQKLQQMKDSLDEEF